MRGYEEWSHSCRFLARYLPQVDASMHCKRHEGCPHASSVGYVYIALYTHIYLYIYMQVWINMMTLDVMRDSLMGLFHVRALLVIQVP